MRVQEKSITSNRLFYLCQCSLGLTPIEALLSRKLSYCKLSEKPKPRVEQRYNNSRAITVSQDYRVILDPVANDFPFFMSHTRHRYSSNSILEVLTQTLRQGKDFIAYEVDIPEDPKSLSDALKSSQSWGLCSGYPIKREEKFYLQINERSDILLDLNQLYKDDIEWLQCLIDNFNNPIWVRGDLRFDWNTQIFILQAMFVDFEFPCAYIEGNFFLDIMDRYLKDNEFTIRGILEYCPQFDKFIVKGKRLKEEWQIPIQYPLVLHPSKLPDLRTAIGIRLVASLNLEQGCLDFVRDY